VSRPAARAEGWGIPVPGDPDQVVYVWWDALTNYITALGYGSDNEHAYRDWWIDAAERVHVIGKGITRFHAVHWLALLLSAGQPLPTAIYVHEYLSVGGAKISKSAGRAVSPYDLIGRYGTDAVRWWLLREVARHGDTDFTVERLIRRTNHDLSNGIGNLQNRTLALVTRYRGRHVPEALPPPSTGAELVTATEALPHLIDRALGRFDFRAATEAISNVVDLGNRLVNAEKPWELARAGTAGDPAASARLDEVLAVLIHACRVVSIELQPFIPTGATALLRQLHAPRTAPPTPVFPRHPQARRSHTAAPPPPRRASIHGG
jgi:methionyl-tRNA synthetase